MVLPPRRGLSAKSDGMVFRTSIGRKKPIWLMKLGLCDFILFILTNKQG